MRGAPAANDNNNKQTGIDGKRLLSGLIAHHLEDLTVVVNEREKRGAGCWQRASRQRGCWEKRRESGGVWHRDLEKLIPVEQKQWMYAKSSSNQNISLRFGSTELFGSLFNLDVINALTERNLVCYQMVNTHRISQKLSPFLKISSGLQAWTRFKRDLPDIATSGTYETGSNWQSPKPGLVSHNANIDFSL